MFLSPLFWMLVQCYQVMIKANNESQRERERKADLIELLPCSVLFILRILSSLIHSKSVSLCIIEFKKQTRRWINQISALMHSFKKKNWWNSSTKSFPISYWYNELCNHESLRLCITRVLVIFSIFVSVYPTCQIMS